MVKYKTTAESRANLTRAAKLWPSLCKDRLDAFDSIAPGWKVVKEHWVGFDIGDKDLLASDIIFELPGGVFIRGWDYSGYINKMPKVRKKRR